MPQKSANSRCEGLRHHQTSRKSDQDTRCHCHPERKSGTGRSCRQTCSYLTETDESYKVRVFDCEEEAIQAVLTKHIHPGEVVFIRYEGPKGSGMPEMFYTTEAIASDPELIETITLITDGRFSGATRGPAIDHVSLEASEGDPIALVEDGDLIHINIPARRLDITDVAGIPKSPEEMEDVLSERRVRWTKPAPRFNTGILSIFTRNSISPMKGAYMKIHIMADPATLLTVTTLAVGLLLILVLWAKLHPFLSLLITAIFLGISSGMPLEKVSTAIQNGLGRTLGFVATVVGIGSIFGQILEASGGTEAIAKTLIQRFEKKEHTGVYL